MDEGNDLRKEKSIRKTESLEKTNFSMEIDRRVASAKLKKLTMTVSIFGTKDRIVKRVIKNRCLSRKIGEENS